MSVDDARTFLNRAHLRRKDPIMLATVSGIATTNVGMIEWFFRTTPVAIITTKSIQVDPNPGNREPVITEPQPGCFGNAVGLRNPGLERAKQEFRQLRRRLWEKASRTDQPLLNISIAGRNAQEFSRLTRSLAPFADMLELNLSCPHTWEGYGSTIGCSPHLVDECTRAAVEAAGGVPVFAKLTPNVDPLELLGLIARRAVAAGAAGITAINTVGPDQYRDPETGSVILNNPAPPDSAIADGLGGQSGRWIRSRALECVSEIRRVLGPGVPIIGMGGVENVDDARALRTAGADAVGVGSALALVHQEDWPAMLWAISGGCTEKRLTASTGTRSRHAQRGRYRKDGNHPVRYRTAAGMTFFNRTVAARRDFGGGLFELELEGALSFDAGQSCFLRLPDIGEKPFSPAVAEPATFLIRRRGPMTEALGRLKHGDSLFIRGPYGSGVGVINSHTAENVVRDSRNATALILAAGSGAALVPRLAERLAATGASVEAWIGVRDEVTGVPLDAAIRRHAALHLVVDRGVVGRVLQETDSRYGRVSSPGTLWTVGPEPFMEAAVELGLKLGLPLNKIFLSLEEEMLCGVGLCGMCHRNGHLTCQYGTFVEAS